MRPSSVDTSRTFVDNPTPRDSPVSAMDPFAEELHAFIDTCQIEAGEDAHAPAALRAIAIRVTEALPQPRTGTEFLVLRSLLTDFAVRALQAHGAEHTALALLPLIQVSPPNGDLAAAFVDCLCPPVQLHAASSIADLRLARAMAVITARLSDPRLTAAAVASAIGVSEGYFAKLLHAHCGFGFRTLVRRAFHTTPGQHRRRG